MSSVQRRGPRVVVGYDGSPGSMHGLEWAVEQCNLRRLPLEVRSVVEPVGPLALDVLDPVWPEDDQALADQLARDGATIAARGCRFAVTAEGVVGHPVSRLVDGSDTAVPLVVGAHGDEWRAPRLLGSVAFAVTVHARCPVAVVHGSPPRRLGAGNPVVVGVDGSRSSTAALLQATDLAARSGAELVVVAAWGPSAHRSGGHGTRPGHPDTAARTAAESAAAAEADRAHHVRPGLAVSTHVIEGAAAKVLTELTATAGAVVVGSRGHGGFSSLLLGSVTRRLVHEARCPVVVARRVPASQEQRRGVAAAPQVELQYEW
jgi:nucleotide-binding universal stress UspA family protein